MLDKRLRSYYKRMLSGNKNMAARAADFITLRLIIYVVSYVWFSTTSRNIVLGAVMAAIITLMVSVALELHKSIRLEKYVQVKRKEMAREHLFESLVMAQRDAFFNVVHELAVTMGYMTTATLSNGFICQNEDASEKTALLALQHYPDHEVGAQQMLECYRTAKSMGLHECMVVATAPFSDSARTFIRKLQGFSVELISRDRLLELAAQAGLLPSDEEVEAALLEDLQHKQMTLQKLKKEATQHKKARTYFYSGLLILAVGFITGHTVYYPLMAGVCFFMAFLSYYTGKYGNAKPNLEENLSEPLK